jgi:hypothetical protein
MWCHVLSSRTIRDRWTIIIRVLVFLASCHYQIKLDSTLSTLYRSEHHRIWKLDCSDPSPIQISYRPIVLPSSQNKYRYGIHVGQTFLHLIRFVENKFIIKIDSTIYLMILIMYFKSIWLIENQEWHLFLGWGSNFILFISTTKTILSSWTKMKFLHDFFMCFKETLSPPLECRNEETRK